MWLLKRKYCAQFKIQDKYLHNKNKYTGSYPIVQENAPKKSPSGLGKKKMVGNNKKKVFGTFLLFLENHLLQKIQSVLLSIG